MRRIKGGCRAGGCVCCAIPCEAKHSCLKHGGHCVTYKSECYGTLHPRGCKGKKCKCCVKCKLVIFSTLKKLSYIYIQKFLVMSNIICDMSAPRSAVGCRRRHKLDCVFSQSLTSTAKAKTTTTTTTITTTTTTLDTTTTSSTGKDWRVQLTSPMMRLLSLLTTN